MIQFATHLSLLTWVRGDLNGYCAASVGRGGSGHDEDSHVESYKRRRPTHSSPSVSFLHTFSLLSHYSHTPTMSSTPFPDDAERLQKYIEDRRVVGYDPLVQPALLKHDFPASKRSQDTVAHARFAASRIIAGQDDRLLVIVGPCSIHDPQQALEYAELLKTKIPEWDGLLIVMRAYL